MWKKLHNVEHPLFVLFVRFIGHKFDKNRQLLLGRRKPMTMSIKGTGYEEVDWIYMSQDVVDWCACISDLHKRMEIYFSWRTVAMD